MLIDGGTNTARLADAVAPVPPSFDVTGPVTLFCAPVPVAVTFTLKVQDELPVRAALARLTVAAPAVAVMVPPPHPPVSPFGVETTSPDGNVSLNAIPLSDADEFGFETVKLNVVVPFAGMELAPKVFVIVGGATTVRVAVLLGTPVPPSLDVIAPVVFA